MQGVFKKRNTQKNPKYVQTHPWDEKIIEQKVFMFPDLDALFNRRDWMSPAKPPAHSNKFKSCSQENTQQEKEQVAFNYNKRVSASNKPACPKHYPFLKDRLSDTTSSCIIPFTKQDTQTYPPRFLLNLLFHHPSNTLCLAVVVQKVKKQLFTLLAYKEK